MLTARAFATGALAWLAMRRLGRAQDRPRVGAAIALGADISGFVDAHRFDLQRKGYGFALRHPAVLRAIDDTRDGIALAYFEWDHQQRIVVPWARLASAEDAERFAVELITGAGRASNGSTGIAAAIRFGAVLLQSCPFAAERLILDISGDGRENAGGQLLDTRDAAVAAGIVVNALPVTGIEAGIADYYRAQVQGGEGSFTMPAADYDDLAHALVNKLIREIAGRAPCCTQPA